MKHALARAGVLALAAGALVVTPTAAQAETEVVVFKNQVFQPDTRSGGEIRWPVGGGIRMITGSTPAEPGQPNPNKATFAFATGANAFALGSAPIGHDANVKSGGLQALPGVQIYGDTNDNDLPDDALWVWEEVYQTNGSDIWLTNGSPDAIKAIAPSCTSGTCTGGSGSPWHGSEQAWGAALVANGYDPSVIGLGESLGSGITGNVLVTSINAGQTFWTFSRANAPVPEPVVVDPATRVQVTVNTSCRQAVFTATLPAPGAGEVYSQARVGFRFVSAGSTILRSTVGVNETQSRTVTFTRSTTNVPRVKTYKTAPGQAATGYPNVLVQDEGVNRNCTTVGAPTP